MNKEQSIIKASLSTKDPAFDAQWHLHEGDGINAEAAWDQYTGQGVVVSFLDDGFDIDNPDLGDNVLPTSYDHVDSDPDIRLPGDGGSHSHGTYVAGIAIGSDNGTGGLGVAFDATWHGHRVDFDGNVGLRTAWAAGLEDTDVFNNSWSFTDAYSDNFAKFAYQASYSDKLDDALSHGRGGLGVNVVVSAGNTRAEGISSNSHNLQNDIGTIAVGAIDRLGKVSDFSAEGANLLVSAPGQGVLLLQEDNTTYRGNGTSFAAPQVTGAVALMLEANPALGWRDVQEILAISAKNIFDGGENAATNLNGGGMKFSNDYGFGKLDVSAATNLAKLWTKQSTSENMEIANSFREMSGAEVSEISMQLAEGISIDQVTLHMDWDDADFGDVALTLVSPSGTESVLISGQQTSLKNLDFSYSSNAFWGEQASGNWKVLISDAATGEAKAVSVTDVELSAYGDTQDRNVHYITSSLVAGTVINDMSGGIEDTVNTTATREGVRVSLAGTTSQFEGIEFTVGVGIENVVTGDGDDFVQGSDGHNTIFAGNGDNVVFAFDGSDYIVTGSGADKISGGDGCDKIVAGDGDDLIDGGFCNDTILAGSGHDTVVGGEGDDLIFGGGGNDFVLAGPGDDRVFGGRGHDTIEGGEGNDSLWGGHGYDIIKGGDGNDFIDGGEGNDRLYGDAGHDRIYGGSGNDVMFGGDGNDSIDGGTGDDILFGGEGNDRLDGGPGADHLYGGRGDDVYIVDNEFDVVREYAGEGNDFIMFTGFGNFRSGDHIERGRLMESAMHSTLEMNAGDNQIWGNSVSNTIFGGAGNDSINAGGGENYISGGSGQDVFIFDENTRGASRIVDFEDGLDMIDISRLIGPESGDPIANQDISINQVGSDVTLTFDPNGDSFVFAVLENQSAASIGLDDLIF